MLLYLVKHLHPNLANVTTELSKANNGKNPTAYKELLHVIKYVLDTKNLGVKIQPLGNTNKCCFSNNYVGDPVSRRSISGFILYILGVMVSWHFKSQRSVSLSSSEMECVALSEAVKEVRFVIQLLGSMKVLVKYPVMERVE